MLKYWCITKRKKELLIFFLSKELFSEKSTPNNDTKQLRPIRDYKHVDTL